MAGEIIFLICLLTTVISSDVSHQPDNPQDFSPIEHKKFTGNSHIQSELRATPDDARRLISEAIAYIDEHGKEAAYKAFNDQKGKFCYKDIYIFVIDMDGLVLAHGGDSELIGTNQYYLKDSV